MPAIGAVFREVKLRKKTTRQGQKIFEDKQHGDIQQRPPSTTPYDCSYKKL